MTQVEIRLDGRVYRIACEDGQEQRLVELAEIVDGHISAIIRQLGHVGHGRLLAMASLLITDELVNLRESADQATADVREEDREQAAETMERLAGRIEALAERLDQS